jgi:RND superfamily putative drug exporter
MDYEVFLVSGMREEFVHTGDAKRAVRSGFAGAARVVTAAALIMFFVFFAFVPEGSGVIKGIALGLAIGIFFDAFLVRMTLVPAAMALAGRVAWVLPNWLSRLLPNVDIEGEGLRQHIADRAWAREQRAAISAEGAVLGVAGSEIGPIDISVPSGQFLLVSGSAADRRVVAASLAGRLDPVVGRLQVLGSPLPSEGRRTMRYVALCDISSMDSVERDRTVGEVLAERMALAVPWWKPGVGTRQLRNWVANTSSALDANEVPGPPLTADTNISSLSSVQRATVLVASTLAERAGIVFVDLGDRLQDGERLARFIAVLETLTPARTTVILGSQLRLDAAVADISRASTALDLNALAARKTTAERNVLA